MKCLEGRNLLALVALTLLCVQLSNGFSILEREKRDAGEDEPESEINKENQEEEQGPTTKVPSIPIIKKSTKNKKVVTIKRQGVPVPVIAEDNRLTFNGKVKISELKPCISKAFCEVNSITADPTYETSKEFYTILNRLKQFIDDDSDRKDLPGSGSVEEDDGSASSEESYEAYGPPPRYPGGPGYRRGKSLDKLKKKNKKLIKDKKSVNGSTTASTNATRSARAEAKIEQRSFVDRKTRELNVVDDLAALIKISAEIGQALKSPRRCRALFKKCQMTYDQIINIFNQTQAVETAEDVPAPGSPSATVVSTMEDVPSKPTRVSLETTKKEVSSKELPSAEEDSENEGNRNKKSRHDFSDEDIEYITDTEIQPVKTYALFAPQEHHDNRHPEEILVEEAFKKFENTFPVAGAPENLDFLKKNPKSKKMMIRQPSSEEEEEDSNESGSQERPVYRTEDVQYQHRSSGEAGNNYNQESEEEKPVRKGKKKTVVSEIDENVGSPVDEAENDSDAEIPSSEISSAPEVKQSKKKQSIVDTQAGGESSEEEEETSDEELNRQPLYTRDEEYSQKDEYESVRPNYGTGDERPLTKSKKTSSKRPSSSSLGGKNKKRKPQKEEELTSSEEEQQDHNNIKNMPPRDSHFYQLLQGMNDGKGAEGVPSQIAKGKKKKGKKSQYGKPSYDDQSEYGGPQNDYEGQGQGYGGGQSGYGSPDPYAAGQNPYGSYGGSGKPSSGYGSQSPYGAQSDAPGSDQNSPGFFQSIMSWFSGGGGGAGGGKPGSEESPYGGGYGGGGQPPSYDDYKQGGRPSGYSSHGYGSGPSGRDSSEDGYPGGKRRPQPNGPPQGRDGEESSEEVEDEEDEPQEPIRSKGGNNKRRSTNSEKSSSTKSNGKKQGPPPPMVIVPEGEEEVYSSIDEAIKDDENVKQSSNKKSSKSPSSKSQSSGGSNKSKSSSKKEKEEREQSEEESRENSSEEQSHQNKKNNGKNKKESSGSGSRGGGGGEESGKSGIPSYEKYYTGIFGSGEDIEKTEKKSVARQKAAAEDQRLKSSLLLSTFDTISSSFSTSADKVTDWSEEDNPTKRINVGSLSSNGGKKSNGRYTVVRNRNKSKIQSTPSGTSYESENEDKVSSEEEDKKK